MMASSGGDGDNMELQSTLQKVNQVLKQMLIPTANPAEDLKVDRLLDQISVQLKQQPDFLKHLLQQHTGLVDFLHKCCDVLTKVQTWVMTFALKLWHGILSCPRIDKLLMQRENECVPSYIAVIDGDQGQEQVKSQEQVKGQSLYQCLKALLLAAKDCDYWDEGSVRNAWLVVVSRLIVICGSDHQTEMLSMLQTTDAVEVAFQCLNDSSMFVVASAQELISSLLRNLCEWAVKKQNIEQTTVTGLTDDQESADVHFPTLVKIRNVDSSTVTSAELNAKSQQNVKLTSLLKRLVQSMQEPPVLPAVNQTSKLLALKANSPATKVSPSLAVVGVVRRLWQSCSLEILAFLEDQLSWLAWCYKTLKEEGHMNRDVRLAVMESLPDVLPKHLLSWNKDSKNLKLYEELFQLPVQVLRWQGIQYSLQLTRALHNAQCEMKIKMASLEIMDKLECNPTLLQMLTVPLMAVLHAPDTPRPRRKLLGFINTHTDVCQRLAEVQNEIVLQLDEGKISCVKLVCQCLDGLIEAVAQMPLQCILHDMSLLGHLSSLFTLCWPTEDGEEKYDTLNKLRRSSKITKVALNLLVAILEKIAKAEASDTDVASNSAVISSSLESISACMTKILSVRTSDQALMCKTLDSFIQLYRTKSVPSRNIIFSAGHLDYFARLSTEACWEIRDSALGCLVAVLQFGNDSDLLEAKTRRFQHIIWDCVGDYEGFVQATAISALPIVRTNKELWQDMLSHGKVNEDAVIRKLILILQDAGNPFVRSAAIAMLTRWLTGNISFQTRIINGSHTLKINDRSHHKLTAAKNDSGKPVPKDVPGVVSDYFQDILEAEAESVHQMATGDEGLPPQTTKDTMAEYVDSICGTNVAENNSTTNQLNSTSDTSLEWQVLCTMYQATNSADVETSYKTLDFWMCLFWLHMPHGASDLTHGQLTNKTMINLQEIFNSGKLSQKQVLSLVPKPSEAGAKSLKVCVDNTGCLRLMLSMLNDAKMAALKVCFILHVLQGMFLVSDAVKTTGITRLDGEHDGEVVLKRDSDLHQLLTKLQSLHVFEEFFSSFLRMDFVSIRHIIKTREIDTLDSVLDDLIEPDEEWGLPGDINVDCY